MTQDLGDRTTYIGGSDVGAIIGVSPYATPIEVYLEKRGERTVEVNDAMRMGSLLEDAVVQLYEQQQGVRTVRRNRPYIHPDHPFLQGHVDRLVVGEPGLMDAKVTLYGPGYGEPGTDQVPPHIACQMQWYMGLSGRRWADVAVLRDMRLSVYRVEHDPELYAALVSEAVGFWDRVQTGTPPDVDGTDAYRAYISERFPKDDGTEMVATPELAVLVEELAAAQAATKAAKAHEELVKNRIREVMGEASVLLAPAGKVTWKMQAGSTYTVEREPGRVLKFYAAKAAALEEAA